jgi:hypothetical protein
MKRASANALPGAKHTYSLDFIGAPQILRANVAARELPAAAGSTLISKPELIRNAFGSDIRRGHGA